VNFRLFLSILFALLTPLSGLQARDGAGNHSGPEEKIILGAREMISIMPPGLLLEGRVDTGAALSSIHGSDIEWFVREGSPWVRFNLNFDGTDRFIEEPVLSVMRVVQAGSPSGSERPVVGLRIRIGALETNAEFTVADRSSLSSPVLIGRNILEGRALVDVSREFIQPLSP